ncbi:MAG: HEAT repeat domain-containing protein, partial [Planctomycetota bacterium]
MVRIAFLVLLLAVPAADLDVGVPRGSPLDLVRVPVETPSGPRGTPTGWDTQQHSARFPNPFPLLHPAQVSELEIASYLVEFGEPAAFAAEGAATEPALKNLVSYVRESCGRMSRMPPKWKTKNDAEKRILEELSRKYPYEGTFGRELMKHEEEVGLPLVLALAESCPNRFVKRNAVFALRVFDNPAVLPVLRRLVKSGDRVVRNRAVV